MTRFLSFHALFRAARTGNEGSSGRRAQTQEVNDEFTPRLAITLVGLEGTSIGKFRSGRSTLLIPSKLMKACLASSRTKKKLVTTQNGGSVRNPGQTVPISCLANVSLRGPTYFGTYWSNPMLAVVLALPEFSDVCSLSGKRVLGDEVETSAMTGKRVATEFLKTSLLSGKRAEPEYFGLCAFTGADVLNSGARSK